MPVQRTYFPLHNNMADEGEVHSVFVFYSNCTCSQACRQMLGWWNREGVHGRAGREAGVRGRPLLAPAPCRPHIPLFPAIWCLAVRGRRCQAADVSPPRMGHLTLPRMHRARAAPVHRMPADFASPPSSPTLATRSTTAAAAPGKNPPSRHHRRRHPHVPM